MNDKMTEHMIEGVTLNMLYTNKTKDYFTPDCPHSHECNSKGVKCQTCKHNKKKDFYERDIKPIWTEPFTPGTYPGPLPPAKWTTTCTTGDKP